MSDQTRFSVRRQVARTLLAIWFVSRAASASQVSITDVAEDRARYSPSQEIQLAINVRNETGKTIKDAVLSVSLQDCGEPVLTAERRVNIPSDIESRLEMSVAPPPIDFKGYRLVVSLTDSANSPLAQAADAVDVSSDWHLFPRYGYLAHYDEDIPARSWIEELNRFHINGLQFYDYQYKHHLPLPPAGDRTWNDIANRKISRNAVLTFLSEARGRNMTTMAYNASYAAYADALSDKSGVKLKWATWPDATGARTAAMVKSFQLPSGWATRRILYMDQSNPEWQQYIFARMADLLNALPFDGWHIDTFGDAKAWKWNRSPINFYSEFPDFVNNARATLNRRVVLNTVGGHGEVSMANSACDFVYSELWPGDHPTFSSIVEAADEIHKSNPYKAVVFAAYLHRKLSDELRDKGGHAEFDTPAALLSDAVVFASGASRIELGDGDRMLSNPYFPADERITMSDELRSALKRYYDFQVAYEDYLFDGIMPGDFEVRLTNAAQTTTGSVGAVWTIPRQKHSLFVVHLVNLTAAKNTSWVDDDRNQPPPAVVRDIDVDVKLPSSNQSAGWASPDVDNGEWHPLAIKAGASAGLYRVTIPELHYWTIIIFRPKDRSLEDE